MPSIRIIDSRIPNYAALVAALPGSDLTLTVGEYDNFEQSVRRFAGAIGSAAAPMNLYIAAHGRSGHLRLGADPGLGVANATVLAPMRGLVTGFPGGIKIWGCNVGSAAIASRNIVDGAVGTLDSGWASGETNLRSGAGFLLLQAIARVVGVPVTAAINEQWVQSAWRFLGPTITVEPFGSYRLGGLRESSATP